MTAVESAPVVKNYFVSILAWFGEMGEFCARASKAAIIPPYEWRELLRQMDEIGAKSLPLVALAGAASGVVMALHTRDALVRFGAGALLPEVIVMSLIKETGPVITALIVSGRVGAGIGAELGSMKVTEQIDAIESSAVNPYKFLVATRVLACMLMLPLLTIAADFCGMIMGWLAINLSESMSFQLYLNTGFERVEFSDLLPSTFKAVIFGLLIGLIGCFQGMRTSGGTEGVGRASTTAVVISSLCVILADVVLVKMFLVFFQTER